MEIKTNFYFSEAFLPTKRCKKLRYKNQEGETVLNIVEPSAKEFPIAFIIHEKKSVCEGAKSYWEFERKSTNWIPFPKKSELTMDVCICLFV